MYRPQAHLCERLAKLAIVLLLSLIGACAQAPRIAPDTPFSDRVAIFRSEANKVLASVDPGGPGLSVVVSVWDDVVYTGNAGMANIAERRSIDENTPVELASVSKPITAMAVLQLVERAQLRLNDTARHWLPELPAAWGAITIEDLLAQRSGLPEFMTNMSSQAVKALDGLDNDTLIRRLATRPELAFPPGTSSRYSNTNFVLLAEIIVRASGMPFGLYLRQNLFDPLGLSSMCASNDVAPDDDAHALNFGSSKRTNGIDLRVVGPLGIYGSTRDVNRLLSEFIAGRVVSLPTVQAMTHAQSRAPTFDSGEQYGYGWAVPPAGSPANTFAHLGEKDGFRSIAFVDRDSGIRYVILANGGDATAKVRDKIRFLIQTYLQSAQKS